MNRTQLISLLPMLITGYWAAAVMVIIAFWRKHAAALVLTLTGFAGGFASVFIALPFAPQAVTPLIRIDYFSLYFTGLILAGAFFIAIFNYNYIPARTKQAGAFYVLLAFGTLGMVGMASSSHFASFFISLETASISLYGLIGYTRTYKPSLEAAIKYLVLAAVSSSFLLFGIALVYADFGTMELAKLAPLMAGVLPLTALIGLAMIMVGIGFKLAVVPFHMWSPDVYQGAPSPVTAFIASASKGSVFAFLLRLTALLGLHQNITVFWVIAVLCVATMFTGNLLALFQNNVKRLLAYSSIAQIGYLLIPLLAMGAAGASSIIFYLTSYFATIIAAFAVIAAISSSRAAGDVEQMSEYRGLALRQPALAAILSLSLLSLTGIPLTSGFLAKFYIFTAAARAGLWTLLILGIINSGISAFYYLRLLAVMYLRPETEPEPLPSARPMSIVTLAVTTAVIVFFGVYPSPLIRLAEVVARQIQGL